MLPATKFAPKKSSYIIKGKTDVFKYI